MKIANKQSSILTLAIFIFAAIPVFAQEQSTATAATPVTATIDAAATSSMAILSSAGLADARNLAALSTPPVTLVNAIAATIENNPQRAAALAALNAARARVGIARSQGGLQVGLTGNQNLERQFLQEQRSTGGFGGGSGGSGSSQNQQEVFGFESSQTVNVNASLPIFSGGRISANKRNSRALAAAQAAQTLQTTQDLVRASIETYLNILRGEQLLDVAEGNLEVSRERSRVANVRFNAGAAARLEVLRADADLADAAQRRVDASNSLAQFKAALNILMGRRPETPLRVELIDTLTPRIPIPQFVNTPIRVAEMSTPPGEVVPLTGTVEQIPNPSNDPLYTLAEQNRPTGKVLREQLEAAKANVDVAKAGKRPSLGLSLGGLLRNPTNFLGRFALTLGLSVVQSLFDSGRTSSQVTEARALVEQARANVNQSRLVVANQIETALLNLDAAQKRAQLAETGVTAAEEALRTAQLGYSAGVTTALEVSDAQAALLLAQQQAVNARFDVANAQSNLSYAVGVLTVEGQQAYEIALQQELKQQDTDKKKK